MRIGRIYVLLRILHCDPIDNDVASSTNLNRHVLQFNQLMFIWMSRISCTHIEVAALMVVVTGPLNYPRRRYFPIRLIAAIPIQCVSAIRFKIVFANHSFGGMRALLFVNCVNPITARNLFPSAVETPSFVNHRRLSGGGRIRNRSSGLSGCTWSNAVSVNAGVKIRRIAGAKYAVGFRKCAPRRPLKS